MGKNWQKEYKYAQDRQRKMFDTRRQTLAAATITHHNDAQTSRIEFWMRRSKLIEFIIPDRCMCIYKRVPEIGI